MKKVLWVALAIALVAGGLCTAAEPKVTIHFESHAQVELISPDKTRVLVDAWAADMIKPAPTSGDILAITHKEDFHYSPNFAASFPGQKLIATAGEAHSGGVVVKTIATAHNAAGKPGSEPGTNYIVVVEMAGLRIAHFGDIGQDQLTPEQLQQLGPIDVAVTQFWNPLSTMDATNKRAFALMDQVKPKLILPTFLDPDTASFAVSKWKSFYADSGLICIGKGELAAETQFVIMGSNAAAYQAFIDLPTYPGAQ